MKADSAASSVPAAKDLHVIFVCHGNICRSPMAERVAEKWAADQGIQGVRFTSAAISREETGHGINSQARRLLDAHGYRSDGHAAHQITADEIREADLILAMEDYHLAAMRRLVPRANNLRLLTVFDPDLPVGTPIEDPWGGPDSVFADTLREIERCMPALMEWISAASSESDGPGRCQ